MYAIVEDAAIVAQGDGVLSRFALALPYQEAPVDAAAQRKLHLCPRDVPMEPGVLLQAVYLCNVGGGEPSNLPVVIGGLTPVPILARDLELLPLWMESSPGLSVL